jgi:hypothetical protein
VSSNYPAKQGLRKKFPKLASGFIPVIKEILLADTRESGYKPIIIYYN